MPFSFRQVAANSSENGMVRATMMRAAHVSEKQKQNDDDQNDAFGQIVQHRMRGEVHQIAAIDEAERSSRPRGRM